MKEKKLTYISLFSSAGIGCHGFKLENFECIATNELLEKRIQIQKYNNKCKYKTGYICGDISLDKIKDKLFNEINFWKIKENLTEVDVVIATPPCQGMSVANHKKTSNEIKRNSLIIESIKIIKKIKPKIFIFENVASFIKTLCTDIDGNLVQIGDAINKNFSKTYSIYFDTINFKNYGSNSSRTRTIVIGVRNDYANSFSPIELFPDFIKEKSLKDVIGNLKSLKKFGEIDENDIFHGFRIYSKNMRQWICDLKEGQSAFDNKEPLKIPHRIINNNIVYNKNGNGDKYKRQFWNKVGQCIHTRNDQLASQNTIHPTDDRVFSIRELMKLMTIPRDFKWTEISFEKLNKLSFEEKLKFLKKEEMNIRQSIGEAVPTSIFKSIAKKIKIFLNQEFLTITEITKIVDKNNLANNTKLTLFIKENFNKYTFSTFCKISELTNSKRLENAGYYTDKCIVNEIFKTLLNINNDEIRILEPSVGAGNFLPFIFKKFDNNKKVILDLMDIDKNALKILKILIKKIKVPNNFVINYIHADFLTYEFKKDYDLIIGNPPFSKLKIKETNLRLYKKNAYNNVTRNIFAFFLEKALKISNYVSLITPKSLLSTPEFSLTRELIEKKRITHILDFGEKGFSGVLIETICINISSNLKPNFTRIISLPLSLELNQQQEYICDKKMPYWIIYRNTNFDSILKSMKFGIFDVFRDRQINKSMIKDKGEIQILKSKNISDSGEILNDKNFYNLFINNEQAKNLGVYKYLNLTSLYLTPNMTYKPRVTKKPPSTLVDGSVAILIPKKPIELTKEDMLYYSSDEYRNFYKIARNYQTRSLNIDSNSVFFFGKKLIDMVA